MAGSKQYFSSSIRFLIYVHLFFNVWNISAMFCFIANGVNNKRLEKSYSRSQELMLLKSIRRNDRFYEVQVGTDWKEHSDKSENRHLKDLQCAYSLHMWQYKGLFIWKTGVYRMSQRNPFLVPASIDIKLYSRISVSKVSKQVHWLFNTISIHIYIYHFNK